MIWWLWILLGLVLAAIELITPGGFFIIFFGAGAIVVGVLAGLGLAGPPWLEWLLFAGLSIVSLLLFRRPLLARIRRDEAGTLPVDALEGERAVALEEIGPGSLGKVELRGSAWSAKNAGAFPIRRGEGAQVLKVEGLTLTVRSEGVRE